MSFWERSPGGLGLFHTVQKTFWGKTGKEAFLESLNERLKEEAYVQVDSPWLRYGFDKAYRAPKPYDGYFTGVEALVKVIKHEKENLTVILFPITIRAWPAGVLILGLLSFVFSFVGVSAYQGWYWDSGWLGWFGVITVLLSAFIFLSIGLSYYFKVIKAKSYVFDSLTDFVDGLAEDLELNPSGKWRVVDIPKKESKEILKAAVKKLRLETGIDAEAAKLALINPILAVRRLKREGKINKSTWGYVFSVVQAAADLVFIASILLSILNPQIASRINWATLITTLIVIRIGSATFATRVTLYKCAKCNQIVLETAKTCPKCGTQL